jgi:LPS O-antigen subunit length determinant protein (WzzB/FepE family)
MSNEARRVADTNKKYLESQVDKTADPFIKTKIYALIAQQIETAMMAEVKENFAFKILDPPRVPDVKIKPKRTQMAIIAFVVSLFLGIFVAFGNEYWRNHREELKNPADERSKR